MGDIRKEVHLWRLVENPEMETIDDLLLFGNSNAIFYARQGRLFVRELLALGNFHLARKVVRSIQRRNPHASQETSVIEFNRLRRSLGGFFYGDPQVKPFRVGHVYKPPTEKDEELTRLEAEVRQWKIKCAEEAACQRLLDLYGTTDFYRIGEMFKSGEPQ